MPVIVGLMPALELDEAVSLSDFVFCPLSQLTSLGDELEEASAFHELAKGYAEGHGASPCNQVLLVQSSAEEVSQISLVGAKAAVDCLAFSVVCAGRKARLENPSSTVVAHPDAFHVSPVLPHRNGGFACWTSWGKSYANTAAGAARYWPVDYPVHVHRVDLDENLLQALGPVVSKAKRRRPDQRALRIVRAIDLMNTALRGYGDLIPGHADLARRIVLAVSAMETICHRGIKNINQAEVIRKVDQLPFAEQSLVRPRPWWLKRLKEPPCRTGHAGWAISGAFQLRHAYAHGGNVTDQMLHYLCSRRRPDLLRPLLFIFRKLVIAESLRFGGLDLTPPPPSRWSPTAFRRGIEWAGRKNLERQYDGLLARLLGWRVAASRSPAEAG